MMYEFSDRIKQLQERFEQTVSWTIQQHRMSLQQKSTDLHYLVKQNLINEIHILNSLHASLRKQVEQNTSEAYHDLESNSNRLNVVSRGILDIQKKDLDSFDKTLQLLSPEKVLARGYSISYSDGKAIKSVKNIKPGAKIKTKILDGTIESTVEKVKK